MTRRPELARSFEEDVMARYGQHFVRLLTAHAPQSAKPQHVLDLACGTGYAALAVFRALHVHSRLVAISDDRDALEIFHARLKEKHQGRIFVHKELFTRLPFASARFDFAYACFPTRQTRRLKQLVRSALRVLRPGGMLCLCVPIQGSFYELPQALTHNLDAQASATALSLLSKRPQLFDVDEWQRSLLQHGATGVQVHPRTIKVPIQPPVSEDALIATHLLPTWLGAEIEDSASILPLLDRAITAPMEVTVNIACISATRGLQDTDEVSIL